MKKKYEFVDWNGNNIILDIELEYRSKNGEQVILSIMGESKPDGSFWQIYDKIKPTNSEQTKIIEIWKKYHLNHLHAWTIKQERALEWKNLEYKDACKYLESIWLYEDEGYKYWSKWLYQPLPEEVISFIEGL